MNHVALGCWGLLKMKAGKNVCGELDGSRDFFACSCARLFGLCRAIPVCAMPTVAVPVCSDQSLKKAYCGY
jgi:hypothetical protein